MNDYERIARVIRYMDEHRNEQPDLVVLAAYAGLSEFHFHRLFSAWAGITPKHFLQCLTLSYARKRLQEGDSVLEAALDAGLSGPGRLHDLCVKLEAATPGEVKSGGAGLHLTAGFAETPFGVGLIAETSRGICHLSFDDELAWSRLEALWPGARLVRDDNAAAGLSQTLFAREAGSGRSLKAYVQGTAFQVKVWRALLRIPPGRFTGYGALARFIGSPGAARAVGTAVGRNPIAFLIPCHRVIRETGALGGYRWGITRKRAIQIWEAP